VDSLGAFLHHSSEAGSAARLRAARGRLRRPVQRRQVTAVNTLAQQRQLAFASKTPGRTQHINLFQVGPKAAPDQVWADLPGYGYAAVDRTAKLRWQEVMAQYLAQRRNLAAVVQMVDSRHGFTELDQQLLDFVAPRVRTGEVKLLVLLTKADKLNRKEQAESLRSAQAVLAEVATEESDVGIALFSSLARIGLDDAALALRSWAGAGRCGSARGGTRRREGG